MLKSKELRGINVVNIENGRLIGKVKNTIYSFRQELIMGFSIYSGRWVKKDIFIPINDIEIIGRDVILANKPEKLQCINKNQEVVNAIKEIDRVFSMNVITNKGEEIGHIEDVIISEEKFKIGGYIISDGFVEDIIKGKLIIPFSEKIIFGENDVIIDSNYKNIVLKNDISLKKIFKEEV